MAEKEIYIGIVDKKALIMSRKEAIKKMAKAVVERAVQMIGENLNSDPYENRLGAEELADAALDALLEDK